MCRGSEDHRSRGSVSINQAFSLAVAGVGKGGGWRAGEPSIVAVKVSGDAVEGYCPPDFAL